jgi:hypothetical protein
MQTDQSYLGTVPRVAEFTNPTFIVNLPPLRLRCDRVPIPRPALPDGNREQSAIPGGCARLWVDDG